MRQTARALSLRAVSSCLAVLVLVAVWSVASESRQNDLRNSAMGPTLLAPSLAGSAGPAASGNALAYAGVVVGEVYYMAAREKDPQGRIIPTFRRTVKMIQTDMIREYEYEGADDWLGHVKRRYLSQ